MSRLPDLLDKIRTTMDGWDVDDHTNINYERVRCLLYEFYLYGCYIGTSPNYTKDDIESEFEKKFNKLMT